MSGTAGRRDGDPGHVEELHSVHDPSGSRTENRGAEVLREIRSAPMSSVTAMGSPYSAAMARIAATADSVVGRGGRVTIRIMPHPETGRSEQAGGNVGPSVT
ncbi:hypothetical protein ACIQZO_03635 [Streptomyces sp. NPDC097617]|uniref:hypothetical protein n=1 Tax=Streptomyces sp. NPDC097617 TaxID=3366091 RepID=UPI0037F3D893